MDISAELFFNKWKQTYDKHNKKLDICWSHNTREYTEETIKLCEEIAPKLNLIACREYYSTDIIFCKEENIIGNSPYAILNPEIVFEHENTPNTFITEVLHHLMLKANLYVIVTYSNSVTEAYLNKTLKIINHSYSAAELKDKGNFLLIIGSIYDKYNPNYWKGLIFNGDEWKEITS